MLQPDCKRQNLLTLFFKFFYFVKIGPVQMTHKRHMCSLWLGRILGQVEVRPENVEPGRVLSLRPGQAASRPGRVLGRAIPPIAPNPTNHGE